ncbi:uncharacterized protein LOC120909937 isoform X2 [Rana temporaria]|uniref:uncharacterized protein LOC120909937 isoform X2 n=1 Tax=Rana temporaria TaxID=8407 RepID=UPI001AAE10E7|nr:uncharacterized protein LOC120909937 isoform X2 [Rana temporaria]
MEDKGDNDGSICEDDLGNKLKVRKRRSARRSSRLSASVGRESTSRTTVTAPGDQTKASNPDSCKEENLDGHNGFSGQQKNIRVKEEHVCSGEEDLSWTVEDVSSREADTSGKVDVSSREADTSGKVEEDVSSGEEGASSGANDLGNIETFIVQDSPVTQHKRKRDVSKLGRSKEIPEDLRKQVVEAHKSGKGYKKIAKNLNMHLSTVRKIVYKWKKFSTVATLPRSGRPTKISAKARNTILKHIRDNTMVTAKDLKASLALDNINVHESTIRKTLSKWCSWDFTMEEDTAPQQE